MALKRFHALERKLEQNTQLKGQYSQFLQDIAQLFDPLGLLGPVIVKAKIIMQQLWKLNSGWDESVPQSFHSAWENYRSQLPVLNNFKIARKMIADSSSKIMLHGFCDASEGAYGACIYLRSTNCSDLHTVRLVCSKSRVAPLKSVLLPRLELCAAVLLSKLYQATTTALMIKFDSVRFWSDSTIALYWIHMSPHQLKTFITNRVAEIQSNTE
ncbi:uncharacterized protein LOC105696715, partial [Orussus abietinus]|uniref:uncharacterized protein LOC105696715 n=1 Tax=Orussus abietinus TaxID=222816 RepID=UPI000C715B7B